MGSRVTRVSVFLPANFQIATLYDLGSGMGQTERQRPSTLNGPTLWERGIIT